jgi:hypothetical protein
MLPTVTNHSDKGLGKFGSASAIIHAGNTQKRLMQLWKLLNRFLHALVGHEYDGPLERGLEEANLPLTYTRAGVL